MERVQELEPLKQEIENFSAVSGVVVPTDGNGEDVMTG